MKLRDFETELGDQCDFLKKEVSTHIHERVTANKEFYFSLSDEEKRRVAHDFQLSLKEEDLLKFIDEGIQEVRTRGGS